MKTPEAAVMAAWKLHSTLELRGAALAGSGRTEAAAECDYIADVLKRHVLNDLGAHMRPAPDSDLDDTEVVRRYAAEGRLNQLPPGTYRVSKPVHIPTTPRT